MENAIEVKNLRKEYNNFCLKDISFAVPTGSIVGFVGENGAGKTTTIKSMLDIVHKDAGSITLLGHDSTDVAAAHADVGVVFDESSFNFLITATQVGNIFKNVYKTWDAAYYQELLHRFGLGTGKKDIIKNYSRGMKMKLSLAVALAHRPKLLILDEATSGLDPVVRDEILDLFLEFIQDEQHSILFSSHITSDIEKAADYIVFIHQGEIILNAPKDELLSMYGVVHCSKQMLQQINPALVVGMREGQFGVEALVNNRTALTATDEMLVEKASIDDIMLYTIRGNRP
ncbi:ABC transporter ATP-binding protein [Ruminococcaceae bacterium OttesenSCG-928-A16]|nr:ABC transporter ATP-binding protein [Ruminococcaceae bacterium OttesenSCG-928-A16]